MRKSAATGVLAGVLVFVAGCDRQESTLPESGPPVTETQMAQTRSRQLQVADEQLQTAGRQMEISQNLLERAEDHLKRSDSQLDRAVADRRLAARSAIPVMDRRSRYSVILGRGRKVAGGRSRRSAFARTAVH